MNKKIIKKILIILLIIISIALVLFSAHTIRNYIIVKNVEKNISKYLGSTNYHMTATQLDNNYKDLKIITNYYRKDNKELAIIERHMGDDLTTMSMYYDGEKTNMYWVTKDEKLASLNVQKSIYVNLYNMLENDTKWQTIVACALSTIKSTNINGKDCYKISNYMSTSSMVGQDKNEIYLDKDTGLCMKSIMDRQIYERKYEFDNVSDDIFVEPDINEYKIQESN